MDRDSPVTMCHVHDSTSPLLSRPRTWVRPGTDRRFDDLTVPAQDEKIVKNFTDHWRDPGPFLSGSALLITPGIGLTPSEDFSGKHKRPITGTPSNRCT
jgi:hypothetical protein